MRVRGCVSASLSVCIMSVFLCEGVILVRERKLSIVIFLHKVDFLLHILLMATQDVAFIFRHVDLTEAQNIFSLQLMQLV